MKKIHCISILFTLLYRTAHLAPAPEPFQPSCQPTEPCWPTSQEWQTFNQSVSGRLIPVTHPGRSCYIKDFNTASCLEYQAEAYLVSYRTNQVALPLYSQWEHCGESALVCPSIPVVNLVPQLLGVCMAGNLPTYAVDAKDHNDIVQSVLFAKNHHLAINIKNTGHDVIGRSLSPNSLTIWTHHMDSLHVEKQFQPEQCQTSSYHGPALVMEAGVTTGQAFDAADAASMTVVGPFLRTIGAAGGWLQGSGYGPLTNTFGVGSDQALQFRIVLADGSVVVANECQNQDLFWALRGGGAGTFGKSMDNNKKKIKSAKRRSPFRCCDRSHRQTAPPGNPYARCSIKGAFSGPTQHLTGLGRASRTLGRRWLLTKDAAHTSIHTFIDAIKPHVIINLISEREYSSFNDFYAENHIARDSLAGFGFAIGTRLMTRPVFATAESREHMVDTFIEGMKRKKPLEVISPDVIVTVNTPIRDDGGQTSYSPRWRKEGLWLMDYATIWPQGTPNTLAHEYNQEIARVAEKLGTVTPGGPIAYSNEAEYTLPNFETAYWGDNYPRLLEIKNKYDPTSLFRCWKCVGWTEEMAAKDPKFKCYKTL
ncbi:hypothetical protein DM01DRAFT_1391751 [Hesseltinella vesiculosa]|uniref:FAD-binding PCMH-type domain-containing protein n=1 Tax=Hesseltinella vesiculosa TaxID=101127 RepID=A0A1X2GFC2_9FUNG|nr:hypothetical protein DM01DRAFT_1391751 [Hesseltinella vesiculosa]